MTNAFETWKRDGVSFLAFPVAAGVMVVDELGNNYGSWMTVERFRDAQRAGGTLASPLPGVVVQLSGRVLQVA